MVYIFALIENRIRQLFRTLHMYKWRKMNKNLDFCILCNNCVGAMVTHDLGVKFNSPTVNLFMYPKDYLIFLENLDSMLVAKIENITPLNGTYPIGSLNGVEIHFLHYKSFDDAVNSWYRRAKRLNKDNLYIVMIEKDGCDYDDLLRFDSLPYKQKIVLTHCDYSDIKCSCKISGFENYNEVGNITDWIGCWGVKLYDRFDWVKFLN